MKGSTLKLTLVFMLAVCSLAGCGKTDMAHKNDKKQNADVAVLTTDPVASESNSTIGAASADETEAIQLTQAETTLPEQSEAFKPDETDGASAKQSEEGSSALTEEQALDAIKNYCFKKNPDLKNKVDSDEYTVYWDVIANDANEIVVLFRSYTSAQMRYYIDTISGETYVTEMVPGIMDEEQRTDESFNIKDYLA